MNYSNFIYCGAHYSITERRSLSLESELPSDVIKEQSIVKIIKLNNVFKNIRI